MSWPGRPTGAESTGADPTGRWTVLVVVLVALAVGYAAASQAGPVLHNRMLPWILGRSLGIASYLALVGLVSLGLWFRHPWRAWRRQRIHPESVLRAHVALAVATGALVLGHVLALAADRYAGVGWVGAVVPGQAHYRPEAVALGIVGLYGGIVVVATVLLAGSVARRIWLPVHRLAALSLGAVWFHGVLAGSDTVTLRALYLATGALVLTLAVTRGLARSPQAPRATQAAQAAQAAQADPDRAEPGPASGPDPVPPVGTPLEVPSIHRVGDGPATAPVGWTGGPVVDVR